MFAVNETERLVKDCLVMRLSEKNSLIYLKNNGHEISPRTFYYTKGKLQNNKLKRLYEIGQYGFVDQHLERIDNLEVISQEMWKQYWKEKNPYKATAILKMIADVQPYLSAYYEATKMVIESNGNRETSVDLSWMGKSEESKPVTT